MSTRNNLTPKKRVNNQKEIYSQHKILKSKTPIKNRGINGTNKKRIRA